MSKPIVTLRDIFLVYDERKILSNINLEIYEESIITIIGPNGGGKTSLIKIICGIVKASSGFIEIKKGLKIGYVPQKINMNPYFPITVSGFLSLAKVCLSVDEVIDIIGIGHLMQRRLFSLSAGEMQHVLLAYAMLSKPNLLLMDEPTSMMDMHAKNSFCKIIQYLRSEYKCSVVISSHDLIAVMKSTDYVICLNNKINCSGRAAQINDHAHGEIRSVLTKLNNNNIDVYMHEDA